MVYYAFTPIYVYAAPDAIDCLSRRAPCDTIVSRGRLPVYCFTPRGCLFKIALLRDAGFVCSRRHTPAPYAVLFRYCFVVIYDTPRHVYQHVLRLFKMPLFTLRLF